MIERRLGEVPTLETRGEANEKVDRVKRYKQIVEILQDFEAGLSAKQVAVEMCKRGFIPTTERNFAAPRLTELSQRGIVEPVGKTKCYYTGKTVSVFKLREGQTNIFEFL